jgi:tetratricopeptide (TPR) repeat protein
VPATREGIDILRRLGAREDLAWPLILSVFEGILGRDGQEGEQYCLESLEIFEELDNPYGIAYSLSVLGTHYRKVGRFEEARQCIERGLEISHSIGDQEFTAYDLRNLGHLNLHLGHFETARQKFKEDAALWGELSLPRKRGEALRSLGQTTLAAGDSEEAENLFLESLAEFEQIGDEGNALINLLILGQMALQQGKIRQALDLLQDARPIMEKRDAYGEHARWWLLSGRISIQQGDQEAAYLAFSRALENIRHEAGPTLIEVLLDFALYFQEQSDQETAARLLGFVHSQPGLPALLVRDRIDPLHTSLTAALGDNRLAVLLDEGAAFDQQGLADQLLEIE